MECQETAAKRTILCYGDSNTWGFVPGSNGQRHPAHVRWPGVLSKLLRTGYRVMEEGLCGRTAITDDPIESAGGVERNGYKTLGAILDTHSPLDLLVIMLGTGDLKHSARLPAIDIAAGVGVLARFASSPEFGPNGDSPPAILIVCPTSIWEVKGNFGPRFKGGREKSMALPDAFRHLGRQMGYPILFAEDVVQADPADGIHLSAESHAVLAQEIAGWILERYGHP